MTVINLFARMRWLHVDEHSRLNKFADTKRVRRVRAVLPVIGSRDARPRPRRELSKRNIRANSCISPLLMYIFFSLYAAAYRNSSRHARFVVIPIIDFIFIAVLIG